MAEGSWVPAFVSLWKGPKAAKLAQANLGQRRHAAGGLFLELMGWALDACESGDLGTVAPAVLAEAVGLKPGGGLTLAQRGQELLAALKAAGFVSDDERAHVKGWDDGAGKLIARRTYERERKRSQRGQTGARPTSGDGQGDLSGRSGEGQGRGLSLQTTGVGRGPVPRDTLRPVVQIVRAAETVSQGRPPGHGVVVPVQSTESTERTPPTPPGTTKGHEAAAVDPKVAAAFLIEAAPEPWRSALEAFGNGHGQGALVTWFAGATFALVGSGAEVTLLNDFQATFVGQRFRAELLAAMPGIERLDFRARRRPMGEPEVVR